MIIQTTSIDWDTEGKRIPNLPQKVQVSIENGSEENISDQLTEIYGWCIKSVTYEIIHP